MKRARQSFTLYAEPTRRRGIHRVCLSYTPLSGGCFGVPQQRVVREGTARQCDDFVRTAVHQRKTLEEILR